MFRLCLHPRPSRSLLSIAAIFLLSAAAAAQSLVPATVTDPSFDNMRAVTVNIPAGWKLQGIMTISPCTSLPAPVFRAYSSDGLSEFRAMPVFGWKWATNPRFLPKDGCLPLTGKMTAADFLNQYIQMLDGGVHIVGPMPVDAAFRQRAQNFAEALNKQSAGFVPAMRSDNTGDVAALHIQTINGSFVVDQRIRVMLECAERKAASPIQGGSCWAKVDVLRAPKGKLDALVAVVDSHNLIQETPNPEWFSAFMQRQQRQGQQASDSLRHQQEAGDALLKKQHDDFMAASQQNHQAFMDKQESSFRTHEAQMAQSASSFHSAMNNAQASQNARTTSASDWVDYSLDQQTVTGQGGTVKLSSAYNQTWSSTTGNQTTWYQTNDPNANPNGVLPGNWTTDTKVHGNGQPY
jgi:hypothetical protein